MMILVETNRQKTNWFMIRFRKTNGSMRASQLENNIVLPSKDLII